MRSQAWRHDSLNSLYLSKKSSWKSLIPFCFRPSRLMPKPPVLGAYLKASGLLAGWPTGASVTPKSMLSDNELLL